MNVTSSLHRRRANRGANSTFAHRVGSVLKLIVIVISDPPRRADVNSAILLIHGDVDLFIDLGVFFGLVLLILDLRSGMWISPRLASASTC